MARVLAKAASVLASLALSRGEVLDTALFTDDACSSSEECSLELRQLRGEVMEDSDQQAMDFIVQQMEESKKYEVDIDDESGMTCHPEGGAAITCGAGTKCCSSKRSYISGQAHEKQSKLALYAICCPMDSHCKHDTIFVSCAAGAGADDDSGVLAGLQEEQEEAEVNVEEAEAMQDAEEEEEEDADNEEDVDDEDVAEEDSEDMVAGRRCFTKMDKKTFSKRGKKGFDLSLNKCGRQCAAGFPCTKTCMNKSGYSKGCATCAAKLVGCGRDHCVNQCISNSFSAACQHCNKKHCRASMKACSGRNIGGS